MTRFKLLYAREAQRDILKLDKPIARRIVAKIEFLVLSGDPLKHAKALTGSLAGLYRFRIGDYRAIFEIDSTGVITLLTILRISHRRNVYEKGL